MKWEDFKDYTNRLRVELAQTERPTNIECPQCSECIYEDKGIVLASNPPRLRYYCKRCGWTGTA